MLRILSYSHGATFFAAAQNSKFIFSYPLAAFLHYQRSLSVLVITYSSLHRFICLLVSDIKFTDFLTNCQ